MNVVSELLAQFNDLQQNYKGRHVGDIIDAHAECPVLAVTMYFALVFYGPTFMKDRKPLNVRYAVASWNLFLAVFSILGAIVCAPTLYRFLVTKGLHFTICQDPADGYYYDGPSGFWVALFTLSKLPELMDTVFLVVQKKEVIFLHWFHHCTVMLYCWHSYHNRIATGLWFAAMNYCVHGVMYSYYFLMTFAWGRKLVKRFSLYITISQLLQMVVGMAATILAFKWRGDGLKDCYVDAANNRMGLMMYSSYFVLFAFLFKKLYLTPGGKHARVASGRGSSANLPTEKDDICSVQNTDLAGRFMDGKVKNN